ncbi:MAG: efflux RND transporter periplasmic adaptor subunit [Myxococcales bacterium]
MPPEAPDLVAQLQSLRIDRGEPPRRTLWPWFIATGAVVALAVAGDLLRDRLTERTVTLTPVMLLQPGQEPPTFVATGTVTTPVSNTLAPRAPGRLLRLLVQEGDVVGAGQPVAELDPTDRRLAVGQARAQVASAAAKVQAAEVAVKAAGVRLARQQKLQRGGAGTQSAVEDAQLDVETARAQEAVARGDLQVARAQEDTAAANLDDTMLKAPFRGVVLKTLAQPGDFVSTQNGQGVLQLADLASLEVDAEVAEVNLAKLHEGMPVEVRLDALPTIGLPGTVFAVRPNVDIAKATAIAKVRLTGLVGDGQSPEAKVPTREGVKAAEAIRLFPGMNGHVNFLSKALDAKTLSAAPKLEVAASALASAGGSPALLTVEKDGRVAAVPVTIEGSDGDRRVLSAGPPGGTMVVASPSGITPGDHVKTQEK